MHADDDGRMRYSPRPADAVAEGMARLTSEMRLLREAVQNLTAAIKKQADNARN